LSFRIFFAINEDNDEHAALDCAFSQYTTTGAGLSHQRHNNIITRHIEG